MQEGPEVQDRFLYNTIPALCVDSSAWAWPLACQPWTLSPTTPSARVVICNLVPTWSWGSLRAADRLSWPLPLLRGQQVTFSLVP